MHPKRNTQAQKVIKGQYYKYNAYLCGVVNGLIERAVIEQRLMLGGQQQAIVH